MTDNDHTNVSVDLAPIESEFPRSDRALSCLWSNVASSLSPDKNEVMVFVGSEHQAGTTTVAMCVASSLSRNLGVPIALVEANPFSPALASYLRLPPDPGFSDIASGHAAAHDVMRSASAPGLQVIPGGCRNGSFRMAGPNTERLFEHLRTSYRYTVVDAPPPLDRAECRLLLRFATRAVLVVRAHRSRVKRAKAVLRMLNEARVPVLGVIVNRFGRRLPFQVGLDPCLGL
jgi:MinD-like ATPase involved in chromosome partitioning or flagellar assembly